MKEVEEVNTPRVLFRELEADGVEEDEVKVPIMSAETKLTDEAEHFTRSEASFITVEIEDENQEEAALETLHEEADEVKPENVDEYEDELISLAVIHADESFQAEQKFEGEDYTFYATANMGYEVIKGNRSGFMVSPKSQLVKVPN